MPEQTPEGRPRFTPGPWKALVGGWNRSVWAEHHGSVCTIARSRAATSVASRRSPERSEADAHLIAASPRLYAALEALLESCQNLIDCGDCGRQPICRPCMDEARAALAAARGEQP